MQEVEVNADLELKIQGEIRDLADFMDDLEKLLGEYDDLELIENKITQAEIEPDEEDGDED